MKIEIEKSSDGSWNVKRDGERVGTFAGKFFPDAEGMHHMSIRKIDREVSRLLQEQDSDLAPVLTDTAPEISSEAPQMDPALGDKTPAFVEWLRDNDPAAFSARYDGRNTHLGQF
jgi:hypothetical protein